MITLEVSGVEYDNFDAVNVSKSLDELAGTFSFLAKTDTKSVFPFKNGSECRVLVDGTPVITGFIEIMDSEYSVEGKTHDIAIMGRDKTADVVDSSIGDGFDFQSGITLKGLIEKALARANITGVSVIDNTDGIDIFKTSENISLETGDSLFEALEKYCRHRQVLMHANGDGNIVLTRGVPQASGYKIFNSLSTPELNNIKSGRVTYDNSQRFNQYFVKSSLNPLGLDFVDSDTSAETVANCSGMSVDTEIRSSRIKYILSENPSDSADCQLRATWESNTNRVKGFTYSAVVAGHTNSVSGKIWDINTTIDVLDDLAGLNGMYLISAVQFSADRKTGSTTALTMSIKDAYTYVASTPDLDDEIQTEEFF